MLLTKNQAVCLNFRPAGWKYYHTIRKKAVEREFSLPAGQAGWSGLLISLSIAFFIVIISAFVLNSFNYYMNIHT